MPRLSIEQYIQLSAAGYSAEELAAYNADPNEKSTPVPDPAQAEHEKPNDTPAPTVEHSNDTKGESQSLLDEMRQLVAIMRNSNIRSITMPTDQPPDAAQIAASILAPAKANK